ncbi:transcription factor bHLH25-like [Arachis duranensis]|uniref:transcription factor bHLH25-like n=1 Tax=Arachis duranensis TaxID=130453 RepID=A0A6P4CS68_ARADU|nr:transcription factor bHLH25-like [Arachis duranensis]
MDISSLRGLTDLEIMEDPTYLHQWHLSSIYEPTLLPIAAAFGETLQQHSFSHPSFNSKTSMETSLSNIDRPTKHLKNNSWCPTKTPSEAQFASCSTLLSFVDPNYINQLEVVKSKDEMVCPKMNDTTPKDMNFQGTLGNQYVFEASQATKHVGPRSRLSQPQDHIIAERKRREKLSQRFIALSALVPGLQKTDKASVLGDAIKYLKQLQEKVKALEEEQNKRKAVESVVFVKKSQLSNDAEDASLEYEGIFHEALPEIEARFCDKNVLVRIHCEKNRGVVEKSINQIEKLHLKVTNSSAMTFGSWALDITIIAQMEKGFCMTVKELVRNLRSAFASII